MFEQPASRDYYQILEVGYDATTDEIQKAFEDARRIYAHDALVAGTVLSESERRAMFRKISEAYHTLIAEESRRQYNRTLDLGSLLDPNWSGQPGQSLAEPEKMLASEPETDSSAATLESSPAPSNRSNGSVEIIRASLGDDSVTDGRPSFRLVKGAAADEGSRENSGAPVSPTTERTAVSDREPSEDVPTSIPALAPSEEATGEFLRRVRQAKGLDLEGISQVTKIGTTMLRYIEEERLDRLPAPIYLRNFTTQVVQCLGLEERVAKSYIRRIGRLENEQSSPD